MSGGSDTSSVTEKETKNAATIEKEAAVLAVVMAVERRYSGHDATMHMLKAISKEIVKIEAEAETAVKTAEAEAERKPRGHKATMHMLKAILKEIVKIKLKLSE